MLWVLLEPERWQMSRNRPQTARRRSRYGPLWWQYWSWYYHHVLELLRVDLDEGSRQGRQCRALELQRLVAGVVFFWVVPDLSWAANLHL